MLTDTNVLLRAAIRSHALSTASRGALRTAHRTGEKVCIVSQNIVEFWCACTRPSSANGMGLSLQDTARFVSKLERIFLFLKDTSDVHAEWKRLVSTYGVSGLSVYDARLVAAMNVHGVKKILTYNTADFRRYAGIQVVHPDDLAA